MSTVVGQVLPSPDVLIHTGAAMAAASGSAAALLMQAALHWPHLPVVRQNRPGHAELPHGVTCVSSAERAQSAVHGINLQGQGTGGVAQRTSELPGLESERGKEGTGEGVRGNPTALAFMTLADSQLLAWTVSHIENARQPACDTHAQGFNGYGDE